MAVELCSPRAENARLLWRLASEQHIDQRSPVGNHRVDEMARLGVELGKQRRDPAAEMCSAHSYRGGCANGTGSRRQRNPSGTVLAPVAVGPRPQSALSSPPAALLAAAVYPGHAHHTAPDARHARPAAAGGLLCLRRPEEHAHGAVQGRAAALLDRRPVLCDTAGPVSGSVTRCS